MKLEDLDSYLLEDIQSDDHPSDFIKREDFYTLVLRLPNVNKTVTIRSYAFVIERELVYRYDRKNNRLEDFGTLKNLQLFLEEKVEKLIKNVKHFHMEIDNLEESLYQENISDEFMQKWITYKKDISLISRLMFHAAIVSELFIAHLKREKVKFNKHAFDDLHEEISRVRDLSKAGVEKLDNLYDFYRAKVDEKMNKNVYYLTMLSGIFLPLTLATGFFGMNTGGLPYTDDPHGTLKVVVLSLVLEIIFFLPFILQNFKKIKKFKREQE